MFFPAVLFSFSVGTIYCFQFQLVQEGKYTVFVETKASEMSIPVIERYHQIDKVENW